MNIVVFRVTAWQFRASSTFKATFIQVFCYCSWQDETCKEINVLP